MSAKEGGTILVTNPATDEELGTVPEMGLEEAKSAIAAAGKAFASWGKTTARHRHDILMKFYSLMQEHNDDLARIITLENGKTLTEAKGENAYSASFMEVSTSNGFNLHSYYLSQLRRLFEPMGNTYLRRLRTFGTL